MRKRYCTIWVRLFFLVVRTSTLVLRALQDAKHFDKVAGGEESQALVDDLMVSPVFEAGIVREKQFQFQSKVSHHGSLRSKGVGRVRRAGSGIASHVSLSRTHNR